VTGQSIGTGNASTQDFQLQRTLGGYTQPVFDINGVTATLGSPVNNVYINAVLQAPSSYTISATGNLHFNTAPASGVTIAADISYFWRCRFAEDFYDFENFVQNLFEVKKVTLKRVRS